ncbi:endo alpha-1,4 polygalactosaminidase [Comamonas sp. NLF-1-9]|nr:endo alpha-1,4 polygalactosaminidase [Comamonas sp. NLF-1-9]
MSIDFSKVQPVRLFLHLLFSCFAAAVSTARTLFLALAGLCLAVDAGATPSVALYYGSGVPLSEFRVFDVLVVEPDHAGLIQPSSGQQVYAYVSVGEVQEGRSYYAQIPPQWKLASNEGWQSEVIDLSAPGWPEFFASQVVAPLWDKGYRRFFLDTLDSYRLAKGFDEAAQQEGLVRVIDMLARRFPGIRLILNRGFEVLPRVRDKVDMVAAESLYQRWNAQSKSYETVPPADREWLLAQLRTVRERDALPVLVIDYVPVDDRELARLTAQKIKADGFIPWVADAELSTVGVGAVEPVPRRILVLYDGDEVAALSYSNPHLYLQMPLNYMGYVTEYADVREPLPAQVHRDRFAGVVTWFSGFIPADRQADYRLWLQSVLRTGLPIAILGNYGMDLGPALRRQLGLASYPSFAADQIPKLMQASVDPMMGLEAPVPLASLQTGLSQLAETGAPQVQPLLEYSGVGQARMLAAAITSWGGFVLDPNVLSAIPGTETYRWIVDPFAFLRRALRLPPMPVPDTTTESGRRMLLVHVDGDGFASLGEFAGSPPAAQVLLRSVFEKYRIPQTMSIIEAEVAPDGLYPALSARLEDIARAMFKLPYMEIGSHAYSHPFIWDMEVAPKADKTDAAYGLDIPGYKIDLEREIVGSSDYINRRLAPEGKRVSLFQWTGDTTPSAKALEIAYKAGLLNINGGDTSISRMNPSLTAIGPLGIRKNGYLQVYAPITNENIYTNLWHGPFYGFERAIESFEMTDAPRRIKPVGIYYHTYSASKPASLKALHKVYDWALARPLHPLHATDFVRKVQDFYSYEIARDGDGWRLRGDGHLRTVRLPQSLGVPDLSRSLAVAGWNRGPDGVYVTLGSDNALLATRADASADAATQLPYLQQSNGRVSDLHSDAAARSLSMTLTAYVPLEFSMAQAQGCSIRGDGRELKPLPAAQTSTDAVQVFRFKHAQTLRLEINCATR